MPILLEFGEQEVYNSVSPTCGTRQKAGFQIKGQPILNSGQPNIPSRSSGRPNISRKWKWVSLAVLVAAVTLLIPGLRPSLEDLGIHLVSQSTERPAGHPTSSSATADDDSEAESVRPGRDGLTGQASSSRPNTDHRNLDEHSLQDGNEFFAHDSEAESLEYDVADQPPRRAISGSVIDDAGVPLPAVEVVAKSAVASDPTGTSTPMRTRSDPRGMFEFADLDSGEYILNVAESETHQAESLRARAGSDTADIHLQRKGEITVAGTVLDDSGIPLPNASVRALGSGSRAVTDEQGRYRITLDRRKVSGQPVLDFSLLGFRTLRERIPDPPYGGDNTVEIDITMKPLGDLVTLVGSVQGNRGEPVAGAGVTLSSFSSSFNASVSTGEFGEFSIEAVEAGHRYRLVVDPRSDNYRRHTSGPLVIDRANNSYDVKLEDGGQASLAGTLVDPTGEPLPYFLLWLRNTEQAGTAPIPIQTGPAGRFAPVLLDAGPIQLESRSSPRLEVSGMTLSPGESLDVSVPLDWGNDWLLGRVVDDEGQPVPQARVSVYWSSEFDNGRSVSSRQTRSDAAGFFGFSNLGALQYQLTCSAPGFRTRQLDTVLDSGSELVIQLEPMSDGG